MKHRCKRVLAALCCLLLLPVLMVWAVFSAPVYRETFLGGMADKLITLRETEGKRIVIAGGSGAAFALRSDLLEQELPGYHVINLGMYAGLGSTVPLALMEQELRAGDIVVFMPEQNEQTLSLFFGSEAMLQASDGNLWLLTRLNAEQKRAAAGRMLSFAAKKTKYLLRGETVNGDGVYARRTFNAYGDIESDLRERNTMPGGYDANTAVTFDEAVPKADFISYINDYADRCGAKQVTFCFSFCPMNGAAIGEDAPMDDYVRRLTDSLTCPILGEIENSVMDPVWFFDTNFHLNSAGAILYTAQLAQELRRAIGLSGEVSIQLPEPPTAEAAETVTGDDSQADLFLYEIQEDGAIITGLTGEGLEAETLIVPTHLADLPVTAITAEALAGNSVVRTIILQANLHTIPNAAFSGCSSLQKILLSGMEPHQCTVGAELLSGTEAVICVDESQLAAFKTNYFWSVHALRIQAVGQDPALAEHSTLPDAEDTAQPEIISDSIIYSGNGGVTPGNGENTFTEAFSDVHLRMNTAAAGHFVRAGYAQIGWNTAADGTGVRIGLGSRASLAAGDVLYAEWMAATPAAAFDWTADDQGIWITGYHGEGDTCVLPDTINDAPVIGIRENAFTSLTLSILVLPYSLRTIEDQAFVNCSFDTVFLYDLLTDIRDNCFVSCHGPVTLRINAAAAPVYSTSYYATFADKYDRLLSLAGQKKLVLFAGSSTRYGYDSKRLAKAFPEYGVVNMGVYAYTNALPQLDLILRRMEAGDTLLHAPEFDPLPMQFCAANQLDYHFWNMMEANYDAAAELDLSAYSLVFDSLGQYLQIRSNMTPRSYTDDPRYYDDDGYHHDQAIYNQYGDFSMPRDGTKIDVMLNHTRADYTTAPFTGELISRINSVYASFAAKGIQVLFAYNPRNRSSLTADSDAESRAELDALLREQLTVPVIGKLEDSLMSGEYFYLIDSHLSTEGVRIRMNQLLPLLKDWLK